MFTIHSQVFIMINSVVSVCNITYWYLRPTVSFPHSVVAELKAIIPDGVRFSFKLLSTVRVLKDTVCTFAVNSTLYSHLQYHYQNNGLIIFESFW